MTEDAHDGWPALSPDGWLPPRGYANGVVAEGRLVVLAGQIGWDPATAVIVSDDFAAQVRQVLVNIVALLHEAGAQPSHVVRLTWFITDRDAYLAARREIGASWRELMGPTWPPMSVVVVSALVEPRARVEIEALAVLPELAR